MTDSERGELTPMDENSRISHQDFTRFLAAKAPEKPCPECNVNDWATSQAVGDYRPDPYLQIAVIPGAWTNRVMPVHTLNCRNCGYIKFYSEKIVREWLDTNG